MSTLILWLMVLVIVVPIGALIMLVVGEQTSSPDFYQWNGTPRHVGPQGGVYRINNRGEKVYCRKDGTNKRSGYYINRK
jgi:hypothetical protein